MNYSDDGGLTWEQVVSLAEAAQDALRDLWRQVPNDSIDENDEMTTDYTLAQIHLSRLIKRAMVMAKREDTVK